jgi:hypothetical protein
MRRRRRAQTKSKSPATKSKSGATKAKLAATKSKENATKSKSLFLPPNDSFQWVKSKIRHPATPDFSVCD